VLIRREDAVGTNRLSYTHIPNGRCRYLENAKNDPTRSSALSIWRSCLSLPGKIRVRKCARQWRSPSSAFFRMESHTHTVCVPVDDLALIWRFRSREKQQVCHTTWLAPRSHSFEVRNTITQHTKEPSRNKQGRPIFSVGALMVDKSPLYDLGSAPILPTTGSCKPLFWMILVLVSW